MTQSQQCYIFTRGRKGVLFTLDAILASMFLLVILALIPSFAQETTTLQPSSLLSNDAVSVLAELKMSEVNQTFIDTINTSGVVKSHQSALVQLGEFWTINESQNAANLSEHILGGLIDNFKVTIATDDILVQGSEQRTTTSSRRSVSGIIEGRKTEGYTARAIAKKARRDTNTVLYFHPQGSANDGGNGATITKKFNLTGVNVLDAIFHIALHYGVSNINSMKIKINGVDIGLAQDDWFYVNESPLDSQTHVAYTQANVTSLVNLGENEVTIDIVSQNSGHAHLHPGTRLEILQSVDGLYVPESIITERTYFDNIVSHETGQKKSGTWAVIPINVPRGASITSATLHLAGQDIESFTQNQVNAKANGECNFLNSTNAYNVRAYLDDQVIFEENTPGWLNSTFNNSWDITNLVGEYTNVVSVYLNMYEGCFWGEDDTILYSDPVDNPQGSSYVEVQYTRTPLTKEFGKIDILAKQDFNITPTNTASKNFFMNGTLLNAYITPATLETDEMDLDVNGGNVFTTPRALATPSVIFVDESFIQEGNNLVEMTDCVGCHILEYSTIYHQILVPNIVGFGETFDDEQDALDDAVTRLEEVLGDSIIALDIEEETIGIGKVPSLWGPTLVEVIVWQ